MLSSDAAAALKNQENRVGLEIGELAVKSNTHKFEAKRRIT